MRPGFNTQVVVAVIPVLPGLLALPAVKGKLTALALRFRVSDSFNVALRAIGCAAVVSCAEASDAMPTTRTANVTARKNVVCPLSIRFLFSLLYAFFEQVLLLTLRTDAIIKARTKGAKLPG